MKRIACCLSALLIPLSLSSGATVLWNDNIAADWSYTDQLQGIAATIESGGGLYIGSGPDGNNGEVISSPTLRLSDATTPSTPTLSVLSADTDTTWVFNLSSLGAGLELTSFSMWMERNEVRRGVNVVLQTSADGITWNEGWSAVFYDGSSYAEDTYNRVTFVFSAGEATAFTYIRVLDKTFGGLNPVWTEWDAEVTAVPEPGAAALVVMACGGLLVLRRKNRKNAS